MSKVMKVLSMIAVVGFVAGVGASAVYAQDETPLLPRGSRGPGGQGMGPAIEDGSENFKIDQDVIHQELADLLGITVEEMESALDDGETLYSLATIYDVDFEELRAVLDEAHADALAQAVVDGTITQEQADWILERQSAMGTEAGAEVGTGFGGRGVRGSRAFASGARGISGSCLQPNGE
jgi:hypothetical protein